MRILHLCISCFYIDDFSYQENIIPMINKQDGHEVKIIASTETYIQNKHLGCVKPSSYFTAEGIPIVRIPYSKLLPKRLMGKIRIYPTLIHEIELFKPDVILLHGTAAFDIIKIAKYVKQNNHIKLYVDCHEAFYNSARNWVSRYVLHGLIYKYAFFRALPEIEKVLYIGQGEKKYLEVIHKLTDKDMEHFPLGGKLVSLDDQKRFRKLFKISHNIHDESLIFIHTGKLGHANWTISLLKQFSLSKINARLFIAGIFKDEIIDEAVQLVAQDDRVKYLGWKEADDLLVLLSCADLYLQPGSPSATLQQAICCGAPVLVNQTYYPTFLQENGFYVQNKEDILTCFQRIEDNPDILVEMKNNSISYASSVLDYNLISSRIYR